MPIQLGRFLMDAPIARGGMGEVWRGSASDFNLPVAIKVIRAGAGATQRLADALITETRAAAALDHPNVVTLFDCGVIGARPAAESGGRLVAGSPYIVMEYARGGDLRALPASARSWPGLRRLLLRLLDALGHAHARGVLHLDLKPANVLLAYKARPHPLLTDFGIAAVLGEDGGAARGSPGYMAPEQARWRRGALGPWTDLYALGCTAFALVEGAAPFSGLTPADVAAAHASQPPPIPERWPGMPPGFSQWLRFLLAKSPGDRYLDAAEAAAALRAINDADVGGASGGAAAAPLSEETLVEDTSSLSTLFVEDEDDPITLTPAPARPERRWHHHPADWRARRPAAYSERAAARLGAGVGLFELRGLPMAGREEERDRLWAALGDTREGARAVVIRGPTGVGKTRLARWLMRRAEETGAARAMFVGRDGLGPALARAFRVSDGPKLASRALAALSRFSPAAPDDARLLASLIAPAAPTPASERYARALPLLQRLALWRPLLVVLDGVEESEEALGLARFMLSAAPELPALFLLTARDEQLAPGAPGMTEVLRAVSSHERGEAMPLGPLEQGAQRALVRDLLMLNGDLAAAVEARTLGNPLFARALVGDWIARGLLRAGPDGFTLAAGAEPGLPDDLHALWSAQVDAALSGVGPGGRDALERAAALGDHVSDALWREVCPDSDTAALARALLRRGVAVRERGGWRFVHGMFRESVVRASREAGRWAAHCLVCARALPGEQWERQGLLLLDAGRPEAAIEPLLRGVAARFDRRELAGAAGLLDRTEAALEAAGLQRDRDPSWAEIWERRARIQMLRGRSEAALENIQRALALLDEVGTAAQRSTAYHTHSGVLLRLGDIPGARDAGLRAVSEADHPRQRARCLMSVAGLTARLGGDGEALLAEATRTGRETEMNGEFWFTIQFNRSRFAGRRGDYDAARRWIRAALAVDDDAVTQGSRGMAHNELGELERKRGRLSEAAEQFALGAKLMERAGMASALVARLNLGVMACESGQHERARDTLVTALAGAERLQQPMLAAGAHIWLAAAAGGLGDWSSSDRHADAGWALLASRTSDQDDFALGFERAAADADAAGHADRAARARDRARALRERHKLME